MLCRSGYDRLYFNIWPKTTESYAATISEGKISFIVLVPGQWISHCPIGTLVVSCTLGFPLNATSCYCNGVLAHG